ncbi:MAG: phosphate acyltransferase PlsX [Clostridia bacterium]|nr:phosphate acyltransferase PlsX [Clostridia bacterium]
MIKIVIDAMGGDYAPEEQVKGAIEALNKDKDFAVVLAGDEEKLKAELAKYEFDPSRVEIVHAPDVITGDDVPTKAVREKKNSSTVAAFRVLKEGGADGLVSSGATGAVLAAGIMVLGRIKGISRPALCPAIPNLRGDQTLLCDCGANLECKSINLAHFAIMATAYAQAVYGIEKPKVGLLNNGTEDHKGDLVHQEANALLKTMDCIDYYGNVEGRDIMLNTDIDIVVADGYTGNIALKAVEGCAKTMGNLMKKAFTKNLFTKLRSALVYDVIKGFKSSMDYEIMGGSMFLGLKKAVVKGHGNSKARGFCACVLQAVNAVRGNMVEKISEMLEKIDAASIAPPASSEEEK